MSSDKVPSVTLSREGEKRVAPRKSTSSLNVAYLAKLYTKTIDSIGRVIVRVRKDLDGLNKDADVRLLDPDAFPVGTKLTLSALPIKSNKPGGTPGTFNYYDTEAKAWVQITRISKDKVTKGYYAQDAYDVAPISIETLDAVDHLPIFVKDNRKGIKGMFLHLPNWVNKDNIATDDIEHEKQQLLSLRQAVIDNKGKNLVVTVEEVSDGILLVSDTKKPINDIVEKNKPVVAILTNTNKIIDTRGVEVLHDNKIDFRRFLWVLLLWLYETERKQ